MATSGNVPNASTQGGDVQFERGFSIDDAERLAASFKPSWEFDEAPFSAGNGMDAADVEALGPGGVSSEVRRQLEAASREAPDSPRSRSAPPHAPAARVESHEPEVSVIIDRTITAAEMEAARPVKSEIAPALAPPPPAFAPAPAFAAAPPPAPVPPPPPPVIAAAPARPVARPAPAPALQRPDPARFTASDSIEIPVRKSNKPLFLGIGAAVALALAVLGIRAATSSDASPAQSTTASISAHDEPRIPPPPAPGETPAATTTAATAAPKAAAAAPTTPPPPAAAAPTHVAAPPTPAAPTRAAAPPPPRPQPAPRTPEPRTPRPPPTPKTPPKPAGGGIVRDVPF
jgi:hypothetical protein